MIMTQKKKVVAQLPATGRKGDVIQRYALELEALSPIAEIDEVVSESEESFIEGAKEADALITTWGMRITKHIISQLNKCVVIGVGSVGVDMVIKGHLR